MDALCLCDVNHVIHFASASVQGSQRQSVSHDSHHRGTAHPLQVGIHRHFTPSLYRPSTCEYSRVLYHTRGTPSCARVQSNGQHLCPCRGGLCRSKHQARSLGGHQVGPPTHPFGTCSIRFIRTKVSSPLEGRSRCGQQYRQDQAGHIRARIPHQWWHHPPLIFEVAAHHWKWQCHSQPQAPPLGGSRAVTPLLPQHT